MQTVMLEVSECVLLKPLATDCAQEHAKPVLTAGKW